MQEDYSKKGFDEKLKEETLATMNAKKPMKAAKKGTLKEKKDAMASLLNTVVERTEGMNDAWEHFASADPAFANVASYRFLGSIQFTIKPGQTISLISFHSQHTFSGTPIRLVPRGV